MPNFTSHGIQEHLKNLQPQEFKAGGSGGLFRSQVVTDQDTIPGGKKKNTSITNADAIQELPPFDILLSWLSYVHAQTGSWPLPPGSLVKQSASESGFITSSDPSGKMSSPVEGKEKTGRQIDGARRLKLVPADKLPDAPVPGKVSISASPAYFSTGFDYVNSIYFQEAVRLIEKYSIRPIHSELLFGCKLALSLIIAWCQFPLFNGMNGRQGRWITLGSAHCTRELKMRTDSFRQYIAELEEAGLLQTGPAGSSRNRRAVADPQEIARLRQDCLNIKGLFGIEASHYWSERSIQAKSTVYCLPETVKIAASLPQFYPFGVSVPTPAAITGGTTVDQKQSVEIPANRERPLVFYREVPRTTSGKEETIPGKELTSDRKDGEAENTFATGSSGSFLGIPCYELILYDDVDVKHFPDINQTEASNKHEKPLSGTVALDNITSSLPIENTGNTPGISRSGEAGSFDLLEHLGITLTTDQKDKLEFLTCKARFTGYSNPKGDRDTLDTREALKFALNPDLSLEILQEHYAQVKDMWTRGLCRKNPIGLLHWAITRGCDPRGFYASGSARLTVPAPSGQGKNRGSEGFKASSYLYTAQENKRLSSKATPADSRSLHRSRFQKRTANATGSAISGGQFYQQEGHPGCAGTGLNNNNNTSSNNYLSPEALPAAPNQNNTNQDPAQIVKEEVEGAKENLLSSIQNCDWITTNSTLRSSQSPGLPAVSDPAFWEEVKEIDLAGRFRLSKQELELLSGSHLSFTLPGACPENAGNGRPQDAISAPQQLFVILRSIFEESRLGLTTRSVIQIALRQRLGPGYQLVFSSSGCVGSR